MKLSHKITAALAALAMLLPLTGCGSDPQYYRYDYDLSEYITLAEYKGLSAVMIDTTVTEEEVQNEIYSTMMYFAQEVEVDRAADVGDTVKFSCTAELNGTALENYCEEAGQLVLGFDTYGTAIDDALTGAKAGDTVEADRVFAENENYGEASGQTVHYTFTVTGVYETEEPVYGDAFVKGYLGFDTAAEYEATLRETLEEVKQSNALTGIVSQTWPAVVENTQVLQYPEEEMAQITGQIIGEVEAYTESIGINFDEYCRVRYSMTGDEFRASAEETAKAVVKEEMIVYAIARAENITISDEQYHEYVHLFAEQMGLDSEEALEQSYTEEAIKEGILGDLVKECIAGYAVAAAE